MSKQVILTERKICDLCKKADARYDGRLQSSSRWAWMCESCWSKRGCGCLGVGCGQKIKYQDEEETEKREAVLADEFQTRLGQFYMYNEVSSR